MLGYAGLVFLVVHLLKASNATASERRLIEDLLAHYSKFVSPEVGEKKNVNVEFDLDLKRIISFKDQVLSLDTYVIMSWFDNHLQWDPEEYGDTEILRVPSHLLWEPDIMLMNNADPSQSFASADINAVITYDGKVFLYIPAQVNSFCPVDRNSNRTSTVTCTLKFQSWSYDGLKLDLTLRDPNYPRSTASYERMFERDWALQSYTAKRNVQKFDCCPEVYIDIVFTLKLKPIVT